MILTVRCPKCKHTMKYQPASKDLSKKMKRCVYCGRNFSIKNNITKTNN